MQLMIDNFQFMIYLQQRELQVQYIIKRIIFNQFAIFDERVFNK